MTVVVFVTVAVVVDVVVKKVVLISVNVSVRVLFEYEKAVTVNVYTAPALVSVVVMIVETGNSDDVLSVVLLLAMLEIVEVLDVLGMFKFVVLDCGGD